MTYYIAQMTEADLIQVVELEEIAKLSRWGYDGYRSDLLHNPTAIMLVAREDQSPTNLSRILGFVACRIVPSPSDASNELHINNVATLPAFRRSGIARRLVEESLHSGKMYGAAQAILEVRASNFPAQGLYLSLGFKTTLRRRAYYSFPVEDAFVMERKL
jgi:ribosomal-protein-alanine N-acetyltransferase